MSESIEFRLRGERGEFLAVQLTGRSHPDRSDYWDGNWIQAKVEFRAGGFQGVASGDLRSEEILRFSEELSVLYDTLRGTAQFETLEAWLSIDASGDGQGHIRFDCHVLDEAGVGNVLSCSIESNQTFLKPLLAELADAVAEFPVIGERSP